MPVGPLRRRLARGSTRFASRDAVVVRVCDVVREGYGGGRGGPVPPGDPCFGYRVGPGYKSVHVGRRTVSSICVVDRRRRPAPPRATRASRVVAPQRQRPRPPREEAIDPGAPLVTGDELPEAVRLQREPGLEPVG